MILAAGLSPAWQQTVVLDELKVGEVNRAREVHWCASGKVLNVGLAASAITGSAVPKVLTLSPVGGETGEAIRRDFRALGAPARWVHSDSPTRVCTTILDRSAGVVTELVENAHPVRSSDISRFREAYREESRGASVIILSGSLPEGAPDWLYHELMIESSAQVILDCQGPPLLAALEARPFLVKPNRDELGRTLGQELLTDSDLFAAMRELNNRGAEWVVVSQGKERVWISSRERLLSAIPPAVEAVNPIGSGDSLAAGIAVALADGYDLPGAVVWGVAAAAENARSLLPARFAAPSVHQLRNRITIEEHERRT